MSARWHPRGARSRMAAHRSGHEDLHTYGDHDMTIYIGLVVLGAIAGCPPARQPRHLALLIPKVLVTADGAWGARNEIYPSGVENKLGMHCFARPAH